LEGVSGGFPRYSTGAIQAIDMLALSKIVHRVIPDSIDHMLAFLLQSQYAALQTIDIRKFFVVMWDSHLSKYSLEFKALGEMTSSDFLTIRPLR
jgi:hypothetical protein